MVSPASTRPFASDVDRLTGPLVEGEGGDVTGRGAGAVRPGRHSVPVRGGRGRGGGVVDGAGVDVGLGDHVGRRAGRAGTRRECGDRAVHRTGLRVVDGDLGQGDRTRVGEQEGVADRVAGVDPAVAVQVGWGAGQLVEGEGGLGAGRGAGGVEGELGAVAVGVGGRGGGGVVDGPGVDIGLGDDVVGGAGRRRARRQGGGRAVDYADLRVVDRDVGQGDGAGVGDQRRCRRWCRRRRPGRSRRRRPADRPACRG